MLFFKINDVMMHNLFCHFCIEGGIGLVVGLFLTKYDSLIQLSLSHLYLEEKGVFHDQEETFN